jgi:hypothetical protein
MVTVALVVVELLTWAGSTLLLDARWRRRRRADLAERLRPFQPGSGADNADHQMDHKTPHPALRYVHATRERDRVIGEALVELRPLAPVVVLSVAK